MPAKAENARLARLVSAAVAAHAGLPFDEIEDVRLAVDELLHCVVGEHEGGGEVALVFTTSADGIVIEAETSLRGPTALATELNELSRRILDTVADGYDYRIDGDNRWFTMTKCLTS